MIYINLFITGMATGVLLLTIIVKIKYKRMEKKERKEQNNGDISTDI